MRKQLGVAAIIILLVVGVLLIVVSPEIGPAGHVSSSYTRHDIIQISSDQDFASGNWPGNGTEASPYIIGDLHIPTDDQGSSAIDIRNVSVHFIIRNCVLEFTPYTGSIYGHEPGIFIQSTSKAEIRDCRIAGFNDGIRVYTGLGSVIVENEIFYCRDGIWLEGGPWSSILNNSLHDNSRYNLHIFASVHGQADGGNISGNSFWNSPVGLRLESSEDWTISYNRVWGTSEGSVELYEVENCLFEYNWICDNKGEYGVLVSSTHHSLFINNTVCNNTGPGFYIRYSSYNTFTGNIIEGNIGLPYASENSHDNVFDP